MNDQHEWNRSGGGIISGSAQRSDAQAGSPDLAAVGRGFRRRWASGVAVVTAAEPHGALHGITVSSLMMVSLEPPMVALALTAEGTFQTYAPVDGVIGISILDRSQEFSAERFAGRAPVPDIHFTGVSFDLVDGDVPVLRESLTWVTASVRQRLLLGDHWLIVAELRSGHLPADTDDPMMNYEGHYRGLEV